MSRTGKVERLPTVPDGRKFKPLYAPLVVDLDNRLNVNVHGNLKGPRQEHASNQGWGPWEVNLRQVLTRGNEWQNLLRGTSVPPAFGRYGGNPQAAVPGRRGDAALPGRPVPFYSQVDFDGHNEGTDRASGPLLLPGFGADPLSCFPSFLAANGAHAGYGNRSSQERQNHPLLYNFFSPTGQNRVFPASNMEALLRYGDTGSPALTSGRLSSLRARSIAPSPLSRP